MSKKILLVYAKSTEELMNRQSALGSYIFCLCEILHKNKMLVSVNGIAFAELRQQAAKNKSESHASSDNFKKYLPAAIKKILRDVVVFKKMKQLFRQIAGSGKYDVVLEFYTYASDVGYQVSLQQNIPLILVYDSPVLEEHVFFNGKKLFFKKKIVERELKSLLQAQRIVVYSNAVKEYLNKHTSKKLDTSIHQNVDYTRFDFLEKRAMTAPVRIGFIGSFLKWHRIDLLLQAFYRLRKENYPVELFLVGYGMEYGTIKAEVDKSPYKEHIRLSGFVDGNELLEIKKQIHIGVMPGSNWYGAPNKIFEYGAAKLAVVAPATPTIADLFTDKKDLLLFKQDDADQLFQQLKALCDDPVLCGKLAETLQQKIKNNYSEKITFEFYNQLLTL
jgi:glycosyltransferase involved in cell wall biosynthesis